MTQMCARLMRDGRQLGDLVRTDLVVHVVDRWELDVPEEEEFLFKS